MHKKTQKDIVDKVVSDAGNDQKTLFTVANELLDRKKVRTLPEHEDPVLLANEFNKYYIEKIEKIRQLIPSIEENVIKPKQFQGICLEMFDPTTVKELEEIIGEFGIKTSTEDPIPRNILKMIIRDAVPTLVTLGNLSLSTGSMDGVKLSVIDPLLKKCGLDSDVKKNYRPVNNLLFFSKIVERVILKRLNTHMSDNGLCIDSAFAYKNTITRRT